MLSVVVENTSAKKLIKIDPFFKKKVDVFRRYLYKIKWECDKHDNQLCNVFDGKEIIEQKSSIFVEQLSKKIFQNFDDHFNCLWTILVNSFNFTEINYKNNDAYKIHKEYYQRQLLDFFIGCNFLQQVLYKPLGYAGDYKMLNFIYNSKSTNSGSFFNLIDLYTMNILISQAVRLRKNYILEKIRGCLDKGNQSFLSVACSSAPEVFSLMSDKITHSVEYCLMDSDNKAIQCIKDNLSMLNPSFTLKYYNNNISDLIRNKLDLTAMDMIYSIGLFDYLKDGLFVKTAKYLFDILNDEGVLVIGNVSSANPSRAYMALIGEWYVIHRTEDDLRDIALRCGFKNYRVERDSTGIQLYLVVNK